ncbi:hypothetical protein SSS_02648 [Sarcoptes scabiei]|uniref:Uncharacterized protein n=1 Tax=Sarcoptes scabiei TaxID=52283 RepID=A0A834VID2_SARSC|nr:hypothetical protein SSS_02648 [Sarcoptes scabiei]UXI18146.1 Calmodulin-like protein 4 [Sarcoptes scabiei]
MKGISWTWFLISLGLVLRANQIKAQIYSQNGIREAIFAINAYCSNYCSDYASRTWIAECFLTAVDQEEFIVELIQQCNGNTLIDCNPILLNRVEQCLLGHSYQRFQMVSLDFRQCISNAISPNTRRCLQRFGTSFPYYNRRNNRPYYRRGRR